MAAFLSVPVVGICFKAERFSTVTEYMRALSRVALSAYAGFACYVVLSVAFGSSGYLAYRELENERGAIDANVDDLRAINEALRASRDALLHEPEEILLRARTLGYLGPQEVRVRLPESQASRTSVTLGRIVRLQASTEDNEDLLRSASVVTSLLAFVTLTVFSARRTKQAPR